MSEIAENVDAIPLEEIDVSQPALYQNDAWRPYFARLRREAPVHYLAESPVGAFWSVSTHGLIKSVDTNHEVFSSETGGISIADPPEEVDESMLIENFIAMDPPRHGPQRKTVSPSVAPQNLANLEPLIRERVVDILDNLPVGETFNWVDHVSIELTARMLATLFDFPYEDRRKLVYWSDLTTAVPQTTGDEEMDLEHRQAELMQAAGTFMQLWAERAAAPPKFDLISMLAHGEATKAMTENPRLFLGTILLLIVGGNDTTRNSISGGVVALNEYPDEYTKLRENPGHIPNMVAEMIRWQTPVIHMRRTALRDVELDGKTIREGDKVVMWYLSGNRDETVFDDADAFRIDRSNARQHVSFGYGIHRCMGNRLAEMQLRVLWEEIMQRFDRIELVGEVERLPNNFIRGIRSVPVRIHPK
jgi:cytochrome P450